MGGMRTGERVGSVTAAASRPAAAAAAASLNPLAHSIALVARNTIALALRKRVAHEAVNMPELARASCVEDD